MNQCTLTPVQQTATERLLDAGLAIGLYRRLAKADHRTWLSTALRRTIVPAGSIAILPSVSGFNMQSVYPDAVSIGRVVDHVQASHSKALR